MNYLKELNGFYNRLETCSLSGSAIALWHALMHVNNRARWVREFSVAGSVLCLKAGLPATTFKRARLELRDQGFILYVSQGVRAPKYEMVSCLDVPVEEVADVEVPTEVPAEVGMSGEEMREIFREEAEGAKHGGGDVKRMLHTSTLMFYMDHMGVPSDHVEKELYRWAEVLGDGLVYAAIERAVESGKLVWNYVCGIMRNWQRDNVQSLEDVWRVEDDFRRRQGVKGGKNKQPQGEVIPAWFKEGSYVGS